VTTKADLAKDEWHRLVQLPRGVVAAASAAQRDLPYRTNLEVEAGLIASARGRDAGNAFLAEAAADTLRVFDDRSVMEAIDLTDREPGIKAVLDLASMVNEILDAKVDRGDAMAFRRWLLAITDVVISAARSGDFLGFGGKRITESEQDFRDRLAAVLKVA
jgi:hypothetical protein